MNVLGAIGRVVAALVAIVLLFPGGCLLYVGIGTQAGEFAS